MEEKLDSALDLMRRLPPQELEKNLKSLVEVLPDLAEDLLSDVDQPLKIAKDKVSGRDYLLCDYNREGDSYRSPWSNTYDPPLEDCTFPSEGLRKLEQQMNDAFDMYRQLYFDGGISSVYLWDLEGGHGNFAGVVLIKKVGDASERMQGCWDSIHVFEVREKKNKTAHYKLTSTCMLWLKTTKTDLGIMNLGGSLTRQSEQDCAVPDFNAHTQNVGPLIEEMENKIRSSLNEVYFDKTKSVIASLRFDTPLQNRSQAFALKLNLADALNKRSHAAAADS